MESVQVLFVITNSQCHRCGRDRAYINSGPSGFHPGQTQSFCKRMSIHRPGKADSSISEDFLQKESRQALFSLEVDSVHSTPALPIKTEMALVAILRYIEHGYTLISWSVLGETFIATSRSC